MMNLVQRIKDNPLFLILGVFGLGFVFTQLAQKAKRRKATAKARRTRARNIKAQGGPKRRRKGAKKTKTQIKAARLRNLKKARLARKKKR